MAIDVCVINVGPIGDQQPHDILMSIRSCHAECRMTARGSCMNVRIGGQKYRDRFDLTVRCSVIQGGAPDSVSDIHVGFIE